MPLVRLLTGDESRPGAGRQEEALTLSQRFPGLVVSARDVAASVLQGVHGRRRAGSGETFWQFRPFVAGESRGRIDWRRSARDDRLYVREREWEAAHTVMLWIDRSASMRFVSKLALQAKIDRALVLGLAAADLLVQGGERVGLLGLTRPLAARNIVERFGEVLLNEFRLREKNGKASEAEELPPPEVLPRNSQAVLIGDFLSAPQDIAATIEALGALGARGHLVMIADPVEETFPFAGNTEFIDVDSPARLRIGQAESFRADYIRRLTAHREAIRAAARARGWTLMLHRTDRPATEALLGLRMQLEANLFNAAAGHAL
ncbi:protein of unknown function DUF58 [Methylocella silvestris BL2]|uniref:DUF58 domain-containing protein n=1 Tax=Methylocella silvestris (strain DSM 15510 / CIP 108128 / LMG 27833 / NCIMB 13906 / BL2) TaxID=395965 RepID=B8ER10_METSB|nr:DUF58 domain-containing protein [Methylocella silvestris]ACK49755.1 protein of unknown function DUF58 [Methylocella silvestris BL2]